MSQPATADATERAPVGLVLLWLLAALAGAVDARGIVMLQDVFLSFMSGNSTMLAVGLARADWSHAWLIGVVIMTFVAGAAIGQAVAELSGHWRLPVVVALVTALLSVPLALTLIPSGLVAALDPLPLVKSLLPVPQVGKSVHILVLTFAMGALNAAMQHAGRVTVSITFVTGALVRFGQGIGSLLVGRTGGWVWLAQAVPWTGLVMGAAVATMVSSQPGSTFEIALPILAGILTILTAAAAWTRR